MEGKKKSEGEVSSRDEGEDTVGYKRRVCEWRNIKCPLGGVVFTTRS